MKMLAVKDFEKTIGTLLIENSVDGFFAFDEKLRITEWSKSMETYTGIKRLDCLGKNVLETLTLFKEIGEDVNIGKALKGHKVISKNNPYSFKRSKRQGYFDCHYFPVESELGIAEGALAIFRDKTERFKSDEGLINLAEKVEKAIKDKTEGLQRANEILREKLKERRRFGYDVLLKNIEITDSIVYAKQIQQVILPPLEQLNESFTELFVFFQPRDIVSGDFYWHTKVGDKDLIAAVDCTGHGVPGALISILGFNALNQAVMQEGLTQPSDILSHINKNLSMVFDKGQTSTVRDGMDISLCMIDREKMQLQFAGAFNPIYMIRKGAFRKIKGNRFPIGRYDMERGNGFDNHVMDIKDGDAFYIFSDGYMDQFGGDDGKKFKQARFINTLLNNHDLPMEAQGDILERLFVEWKGDSYQVDDVLVIGFRV